MSIIRIKLTLRAFTALKLYLLCHLEQSLKAILKRVRWSRVSVLPFVTQVLRFKPCRSRRIFQGEKILGTPSFGREVKLFVPCRRFTTCKRSLNVKWESGIFRQNSSAISHPSSSSFHYQVLWWRHLAVQVGTTKDQGLYNKPSAAVHPGALAAGTLPQHSTVSFNIRIYSKNRRCPSNGQRSCCFYGRLRGSRLCPEFGQPDLRFYTFSSILPGKCRDGNLNKAKTASFYILSN